ncbi:hypothetical protein C0992_006292, partial [Termitomyces sp. T32_za158]
SLSTASISQLAATELLRYTTSKPAQKYDDTAGNSGDLYIRSVRFSPDGKLLATGSEDHQIRIWNIAKKRIRTIFSGHTQAIYSLDFSLDGRFIISGSGDKTVRIWDMHDKSSKVLNDAYTVNKDEDEDEDEGFISAVISPNGQLVAVSSLDETIRIWDVATGVLIKRLQGHKDTVYSIAFTPDGRGLVSGSLDKTLKYWDITALTAGWDDDMLLKKPVECTMDFVGHKVGVSSGHWRRVDLQQDYVLSVSVSHDGQWVVSGSKDRRVQFWDMRNATLQFVLQGHTNSVVVTPAEAAAYLAEMTKVTEDNYATASGINEEGVLQWKDGPSLDVKLDRLHVTSGTNHYALSLCQVKIQASLCSTSNVKFSPGVVQAVDSTKTHKEQSRAGDISLEINPPNLHAGFKRLTIKGTELVQKPWEIKSYALKNGCMLWKYVRNVTGAFPDVTAEDFEDRPTLLLGLDDGPFLSLPKLEIEVVIFWSFLTPLTKRWPRKGCTVPSSLPAHLNFIHRTSVEVDLRSLGGSVVKAIDGNVLDQIPEALADGTYKEFPPHKLPLSYKSRSSNMEIVLCQAVKGRIDKLTEEERSNCTVLTVQGTPAQESSPTPGLTSPLDGNGNGLIRRVRKWQGAKDG